jgi:hypothetical protein
MTVIDVPISFLNGLSTDTLPTNVAAGSVFVATDTNAIQFFNGKSWVSSGGSSLSDTQFLAQQAAAGNLIIVSSFSTSTTAISLASYTPASGKTFVYYRGKTSTSSGTTNYAMTTELRNNGTILDEMNVNTSTFVEHEHIGRGSQLVGTGTAVFDIYIAANAGGIGISASLEGYI